MLYRHKLQGGPLDGFEFESPEPISSIILQPETYRPADKINDVESREIVLKRPLCYLTSETLHTPTMQTNIMHTDGDALCDVLLDIDTSLKRNA